MKFTVHPPMRGGRVYGHDDDEPLDDDLSPARCPVCGRQARVFRRTLFGGLVCITCAKQVQHVILEDAL